MKKHPRLWRSLEQSRFQKHNFGCRANIEWERILDDEYPFVEDYLVPTSEFATRITCPKEKSGTHSITNSHQAIMSEVCDGNCNVSPIEDEDILIYQLDWIGYINKYIKRMIGLEGPTHPHREMFGIWFIGLFMDMPFKYKTYFIYDYTASGLLSLANEVYKMNKKMPIVVFSLTSDLWQGGLQKQARAREWKLFNLIDF